MSDGTVSAWGTDTNSIGMDPSYGQSLVPAGLSNVVAAAAGGYHSLVLKADGTMAAWGDNSYGQTNVPPGLSNVVAIAAGGFHNLALKADGTVVVWGNNTDGETNVPAGLSNVVAVAGGYTHSLALLANGTVVAWGAGRTNSPASPNNYDQSTVPGSLTNVVAIAAGAWHSLALVGNGPPVSQVQLMHPVWNTNTFTVLVPARSGRVYRLEYKTALTNGNWTALPLVAGVAGTLQLSDPTATGTIRFYRVRQW
jgi:alpha-tubulin suppressor-like RCC1 family protein